MRPQPTRPTRYCANWASSATACGGAGGRADSRCFRHHDHIARSDTTAYFASRRPSGDLEALEDALEVRAQPVELLGARRLGNQVELPITLKQEPDPLLP